MKRVGRRTPMTVAAVPTAAALRAAAVHQATGQALAALPTTGIRQGIYRFASHAEMNRATDEALVLAVALNAAQRRAGA